MIVTRFSHPCRCSVPGRRERQRLCLRYRFFDAGSRRQRAPWETPHTCFRPRIGWFEVIAMLLFQDGILAFLSAVGLTTIVWVVGSSVLRIGRPAIPGLLLVLPLQGEALAMESDVRELRRIQSELPGSKIVLEDHGMTSDARHLAQYLADREKNAVLVSAGER